MKTNMTFFKHFITTLKSQRGSFSTESEESIDDSSNSGLSSGLDKYLEDEQPEEDSTASKDENKDGNLSLEEQLNQMDEHEAQKEGEDSENASTSFIESLNSMGMTRNGLPVEFESEDQVKELLMKGYDYTQKTQELADQRSEQEQELTQMREEIQKERKEVEEYHSQVQEKLNENEVFGMVLNELKASDPDIFNELVQSYQNKMSMYQSQLNNPMFKQYADKITALESQLQNTTKQTESEKDKETLEQWESGLSETQQSYGAKLKKLGVRPNWEKVRQIWASDSSGQMTVQQAMLATHGDAIQKALEAQNKLAKTKAKSNLRRGPQNDSGAEYTHQNESQHGSGTYMPDLEKIAQKYAS